MNQPPSSPGQFEREAQQKFRELQHQAGFNTSRGKQLSRRASMLIQLLVLLLIVVGIVILYHFLH